MKTLLISVLLLAACGSQTNPDACCTDAADCATKGLPDGSMCTGGLICRGNTCVAEDCTSSADCEAGAPFCPSSGLCAATCDADAECPGFGGNAADKFCTADGTCVACLMNSDCDVAAPICDTGSCRGCKLDSECASEICGANGSCMDPSSVVYMSTTGSDSGTCSHASPCKGLAYAATQTSDARSTISIANGTYTTLNSIQILTAAAHIDVHGNHATLIASESGGGFIFTGSNIAVTLRDLTVDDSVGDEGFAITVQAASFYSVTVIAGSGGIEANGAVDAHQLIVHDGRVGIDSSSTMTIDGGQVVGGQTGIQGSGTFQLSNLLVYGQSFVALDLSSALGATVSFSTIVGSQTTGAVSCKTSGVTEFLSDSIVWVPNNMNAAALNTACQLARMIVGPVAVVGAANTDPMFVNLAGHDFHLAAGSPAIDMVNQGPPTDFEGDARPQGARFDTGADEYKP